MTQTTAEALATLNGLIHERLRSPFPNQKTKALNALAALAVFEAFTSMQQTNAALVKRLAIAEASMKDMSRVLGLMEEEMGKKKRGGLATLL